MIYLLIALLLDVLVPYACSIFGLRASVLGSPLFLGLSDGRNPEMLV